MFRGEFCCWLHSSITGAAEQTWKQGGSAVRSCWSVDMCNCLFGGCCAHVCTLGCCDCPGRLCYFEEVWGSQFGNFWPAGPAGSQCAHELGHGRTAAVVFLLLWVLKWVIQLLCWDCIPWPTVLMCGLVSRFEAAFERMWAFRTVRPVLSAWHLCDCPRRGQCWGVAVVSSLWTTAGTPASSAVCFVLISHMTSWAYSCRIRVEERDHSWRRKSHSLLCPRLSSLEELESCCGDTMFALDFSFQHSVVVVIVSEYFSNMPS